MKDSLYGGLHLEKLMGVFGRFFNALRAGAAFSFVAPTFVSLVAFTSVARADFDLAISGSARSFPLSGLVEAESGYGARLWGDTNSQYKYGYLRTRLDGATAGSYNSLQGSLEFFPIAILGARAGFERVWNDQEYTAHPCDGVACEGIFDRSFFEAEATLGAGPVFVQGRWRREHWSYEGALDFIDPASSLRLKAAGEFETVYFGIAGWKLSEKWTLMGIVRYAEIENGFSRFPYGVVRYKSGAWSAGVGAGQFESTLQDKDVSAVTLVRWEIAPSLALE